MFRSKTSFKRSLSGVFYKTDDKITVKKLSHSSIKYRSFTRFDNADFLDELNMEIVNFKCSQTDLNMNFATWNTLFLSVLNKHAPIKEKRVKRTSKPVWLTEEITNAQQNKNYYHKKQDWKNFKVWRSAKKGFFENAVNETKIVHFFGNMLKA